MTVLQFLQRFHLPSTRERTPGQQPTTSEIRRWCEQRAAHINGQPRSWRDPITFPVWQLIFFPHSPTRTTFIDITPAPKEGGDMQRVAAESSRGRTI